uniref:Glutamate-rich protein 6B isoform X2 n=1 Tax=Phascolarctos cinereus TaxID=38626 RepID=A0A6P5J7H6_PHACI|nr:glutamate-rich protein 6B isoform X2 [Phascolarctos cinereus]
MSEEEQSLPLNANSSSYGLSFGSLSPSKEKYIDQEPKKLLPEILVTKETEGLPNEKTQESECLKHDEIIPLQSPLSATSTFKALPSSSFSFSPVKNTGVQLKSPERKTSSFMSFKSEEGDFKERLKSVVKVISGVSFPSTSFYTEDSSGSSIYTPVSIPVPAKQLESRLLEIEKSVSVHHSTQTKWTIDDESPRIDGIESVTISYEKLPSEGIEISPTQNQLQTTTTESVQPSPSFLQKKEESNSQETPRDKQSKPQGRIPSPSRTYQSVFKCVLRELLEKEEKEGLDIDVSPTAQLRGDTRKKLAHMFKTNFERYKDVFTRILKKRRTHPTAITENSNVIDIEEYRIIRSPEVSPVASVHELVVMDEVWLEEVTKAHRGFGVPTFYKGPKGKDCDSKPLSIFFPDGTEDCDAFTYMIFKDEENLHLQALLNNMGHATFYDKEQNIRMCLGLNLGFYFDAKGRQKAWNWWDPNQHIHAPPHQSIYFDLNPCFGVHVKTQDKVLITFSYYKQKIHLNLGTKVKVKDSETEMKLQHKALLETHKMQKEFQKTNSLLQKMKGLSCLTKVDLENFIKGYPSMSAVEEHLRAGKLRVLCPDPSRG